MAKWTLVACGPAAAVVEADVAPADRGVARTLQHRQLLEEPPRQPLPMEARAAAVHREAVRMPQQLQPPPMEAHAAAVGREVAGREAQHPCLPMEFPSQPL